MTTAAAATVVNTRVCSSLVEYPRRKKNERPTRTYYFSLLAHGDDLITIFLCNNNIDSLNLTILMGKRVERPYHKVSRVMLQTCKPFGNVPIGGHMRWACVNRFTRASQPVHTMERVADVVALFLAGSCFTQERDAVNNSYSHPPLIHRKHPFVRRLASFSGIR